MRHSEQAAAAARVRATLEMHADGIALVRARLRREHPRASRAQLAALLQRWLLDRPLDGEGRLVPWPRGSARRSRAR